MIAKQFAGAVGAEPEGGAEPELIGNGFLSNEVPNPPSANTRDFSLRLQNRLAVPLIWNNSTLERRDGNGGSISGPSKMYRM